MNTNVLNPSEVIDLMIDLRFQSAALKHKINLSTGQKIERGVAKRVRKGVS